MEKRIERLKKNCRDASFYVALVKAIFNKKVVNTSGMYEIIDNINESFGFLSKNSKSRIDVLNTLVKILGNRWLEQLEDDSPRKGRGKGMIYSLRIVNPNDINYLESDIRKFFNLESKKRKPGFRKGRTKGSENFLPNRRVVEKVISVLTWLIDNNTCEIPRDTLVGITSMKGFSNSTVEGWISSLKKADIDLDAYYINLGNSRIYLKINNPKDLFLELGKFCEKTYNMDYGVKNVLGIQNSKKLYDRKSNCDKVDASSDNISYDRSIKLFAIGGIIQENGGKSIGIDDLCKNILNGFNIIISKFDILKLIKDEPNLESIQNGLRVGFTSSESWKNICETYSPENFKEFAYVRLTLSLEEVKEYFPETVIITEFSNSDRVYKITFSKTKHSMKKWTLLYRKFRGVDSILDNTKLVEMIENEIDKQNSRMYVNDLVYNIESNSMRIES